MTVPRRSRSSFGTVTGISPAVLLIRGARFEQVQSAADQRVPAGGGIGQGDRHLAQRDTAHGAAVLAGCADRIGGGLLVSRFIHDQHRVPVIEVTGRPSRRDTQDLLLVPDRTGQQVLQPARPAIPAASAIVQQL